MMQNSIRNNSLAADSIKRKKHIISGQFLHVPLGGMFLGDFGLSWSKPGALAAPEEVITGIVSVK